MKFTVQLLIENDNSLPLSIPIDTLDRPCEHVECVGLRLEEGKAILRRLQDGVLRRQLAQHLESQRPCPHHCPPERRSGNVVPRHGIADSQHEHDFCPFLMLDTRHAGRFA